MLEEQLFKEFISFNERKYPELNGKQRDKFSLIQLLVNGLFDSKGKTYFQTISSLIISSLTSCDNSPIDIYSEKKNNNNNNNGNPTYKISKILEREVENDSTEQELMVNKGQEFLEVLKRFTKQYGKVENIFIKSKDRINRTN